MSEPQLLEIFIVTLFPEMFEGVLGESILKRALERGIVKIHLVNFRDFTTDKHRTVDDYPFGGGAGMLLKAEPLFNAIESIRETCSAPAGMDEGVQQARIVLMSPQGCVYTQTMAEEFTRAGRIVLVCGHYEGFDDRVRQHLVTDEVSLGDFVLTGGEIAAMAIVDSVVRLLPGVLGNEGSLQDESHASGLLEYPQYTRPANFRGYAVPPTLLSGNHAEIERWRERHALYRTWRERPDILQKISLTESQQKIIARFETDDFTGIDVPT